MLWTKMLQRTSPPTPRKDHVTHTVPWPREIENVVENFTESAAGSARTAPVDDTVNKALALRSRVTVRASFLKETK